jgi:hypothetical protein
LKPIGSFLICRAIPHKKNYFTPRRVDLDLQDAQQRSDNARFFHQRNGTVETFAIKTEDLFAISRENQLVLVKKLLVKSIKRRNVPLMLTRVWKVTAVNAAEPLALTNEMNVGAVESNILYTKLIQAELNLPS